MDEIALERPKTSRALHIWGIVITVAWIVAVGLYARWDRAQFAAMTPDQYGDFFGGAFAPLAFLWLVLGFFQQGEELRHSAQALWLQGRELQNSVEQQRELVNVTREQLKFESDRLKAEHDEIARTSQPNLQLRRGSSMRTAGRKGQLVQFRVANIGKSCTGLQIFVDGESVAGRDVLDTGKTAEFSKVIEGDDVAFEVLVGYLDERGISGSKSFRVTGTESQLSISP